MNAGLKDMGSISYCVLAVLILLLLSACPGDPDAGWNGQGLSPSQLKEISKHSESGYLDSLEVFDESYPDYWPGAIEIKSGSYVNSGGRITQKASASEPAVVTGMMNGTFQECCEFFESQFEEDKVMTHSNTSFGVTTKVTPDPSGKLQASINPANLLQAANGNSYMFAIEVWDHGEGFTYPKSKVDFSDWCMFRIMIFTPSYI